MGRNRTYKNPTDAGVTVTSIHTRGDGDWRRLQDENYEKASYSSPGIRTDYTYDVEVELSHKAEHQSIGGSSR